MQRFGCGMPRSLRFRPRCAVAAVDAESGDVVLMAEGDWLWFADTGISDVRGALDLHGHPGQGATTNTAPNMVARDRVFVLR